MVKVIAIVFIIAMNLLAVNTHLMAAETVRYQIEIDDPVHHTAQITILFPEINSSKVDVVMPAWRPGHYQLLPLANGVSDFTAKDFKGNRLPVTKVDSNRWRVELDTPSKIEVSYELYANEISSRTRHIDSSHAYLDAVASLLYIPEFRATPISVELDVPAAWKSVSGMKKGQNSHSFVADNYDVLADSPIETGIHEEHHWEVAGKRFDVVIWGKGNFKGKKIAKDLAKMVKAHFDYWSDIPFDNYLFIIQTFDGARGATEHLNSTVIQRDPWMFSKNDDYLNFLRVASHEFVHTWNVKAYRPATLVPYDYTSENYSNLLWLVEGGSSYLDDILLVRSKLLKPKKYLEELAKSIEKYQTRHGRHEMSAASASFDQWISTRGDRADNSAVNIYSKGKFLSLWLDLQLIKQSKGKVSIRELHRQLYNQFPSTIKGYADQDVIKILTESGLNNASSLWSDYVEGTEELPLKALLKDFGLNWSYKEDEALIAPPKKKAFLGLSILKNSSNNQLSRVIKNSPAWKAGLTVKDRLVALNGFEVTSKNYEKLIATFEPDSRISITFFRNGQLHQSTLKLTAKPSGKPQLTMNEKITTRQKSLLESWLGTEMKLPAKSAKSKRKSRRKTAIGPGS